MRRRLLPSLLLALAVIALPRAASAYEEKSLLTPDGTLHDLRAGAAVDLGVTDGGVSAQQTLIEWTSRAQDGTVTTAILPDTISYTNKHGLQLAYDDQTSTLLVLWTEDVSAFSQIRVGVLRGGTWTNSMLLPRVGISKAHNPQMLITHRQANYLDAEGTPVTKTSSILSIVWWEQGALSQARYATLFLDETNFDPTALTIYDLPSVVGTDGDTPALNVPTGAYLFPTLQADGLTGAVLIAFADLHDQKERVLHVDFPTDWGQPSDPNSMNWKRRHIPIVGIAAEGPMSLQAPNATETRDGVRTTIGLGYRPTLSWSDGLALKYTRLAGVDWAPVLSVPINDQMTYDQALALVTGMAERN